jgi:pimeloyl-ACP methyl ester carboxylesterase
LLFFAASSAIAQGPNPKPPIYGVHYSFERMIAERTVNDAHDKGTIRLVSYVYRPLLKDSGQVVVVLHGSTGGMVIAPGEANLGPGPSVGFLIERGFTVVIPLRRGRSESSGQYVEECAFQAGKCSLAGYRELTRKGLADALASTEAVIEQVVMPYLKPKNGKFLLWGSSRGGVIALRYAAEHPQQVRGVVAVSPGWLSMTDKWPADENRERLTLQNSLMTDAARYKGQTLWVYADGDPFYPEALTRQLFASFSLAGGRGRYIQVKNHHLPNAHVPTESLWRADADSFLASLPE